MADDPQVEEIIGGDNDGAAPVAAASHGKSPLVPIMVVVIMLPVLSFLMTEFVLIPRMKAAMGATEKDEHSELQGGAKKDAHAKQGPMKHVDFEDIVANISGTVQSRYIKVSFTVEGHGEHFMDDIEQHRAKLRDATLSILSTLTLRDLDKPGIKNIVRTDLLSSFETAMGGKVIENLYFSDFVVQ